MAIAAKKFLGVLIIGLADNVVGRERFKGGFSAPDAAGVRAHLTLPTRPAEIVLQRRALHVRRLTP